MRRFVLSSGDNGVGFDMKYVDKVLSYFGVWHFSPRLLKATGNCLARASASIHLMAAEVLG